MVVVVNGMVMEVEKLNGRAFWESQNKEKQTWQFHKHQQQKKEDCQESKEAKEEEATTTTASETH